MTLPVDQGRGGHHWSPASAPSPGSRHGPAGARRGWRRVCWRHRCNGISRFHGLGMGSFFPARRPGPRLPVPRPGRCGARRGGHVFPGYVPASAAREKLDAPGRRAAGWLSLVPRTCWRAGTGCGSRSRPGGTGEVWRAADTVLGRAVAVKLLRPEYAGHPETLARFRAEARHAARLAHPGIVQVYDYGQDGRAGRPVPGDGAGGRPVAGRAARGGGPLRPAWVCDMIARRPPGWPPRTRRTWCTATSSPANLLLTPGGHREDHRLRDRARGGGRAADPRRGAGMARPATWHPSAPPGPRRPGQRPVLPRRGRLGVPGRGAAIRPAPRWRSRSRTRTAACRRSRPGSLPGWPGWWRMLTAKDPATRPASAAAVAARAGLRQVTVTAGAAMPPGWPAAGQRARQPATLPLAGITMHDAPPLRPRLRPGHGRPGRATVLAATGVIAAVGLAAVLAAGTSGAAPPEPAQTGPSATAPAAPAARTVTVDNAALDGQPAEHRARAAATGLAAPSGPAARRAPAPRHRHHRAARRAGTGRRHGHGERRCAAPWPQAPPARQRPWRRQRCRERGLARRGADDDGAFAGKGQRRGAGLCPRPVPVMTATLPSRRPVMSSSVS